MRWPLSMGILLAGLLTARAATEYEWARTTDVAGAQRMLTQRMSKEFLLIALNFEPEVNKLALQASILRFDTALHCLIDGCANQSILAAPNAAVAIGLNAVLQRWDPFMALLQGSMNTVRNASGALDQSVLSVVSKENIQLLVESNVVVGRLVDAAQAQGAPDVGRAEDVAARQRMVIQRLCKEAFLVALDVDTANNLASLQSTYTLFETSHRGIIAGAPWAGVRTLTRRCTLQQMREVTYEWNIFKALLEQILVAPSVAESAAAALTLTSNISHSHKPLFKAMVDAVQFFFHDDDSCGIPPWTSDDWVKLLDTAGKQQALAQEASAFLMQVGLGVYSQASKINLTVGIQQTNSYLRDLVEGNRARSVASPPTQQLVDQLQSVSGIWDQMEKLMSAVTAASNPDRLLVTRVARLSEQHFGEMDVVLDLYGKATAANDPAAKTPLVMHMERQRALVARLSKDALTQDFLAAPPEDWTVLNASRTLFLEGHWRLLLGSSPNATAETQGLARTTSLCQVQQMKVALDVFLDLEQAALAAAAGVKRGAESLAQLTPALLDDMGLLIQQYSRNDTACELNRVSYDEWVASIIEIGRIGRLLQKVSVMQLVQVVAANSSTIGDDLAQLEASVLAVVFGSGERRVPAPFSQEVLEEAQVLIDQQQSLVSLLDSANTGNLTDGRAQALPFNVSARGLQMLARLDGLSDRYVEAALQEEYPIEDSSQVVVGPVQEVRRVPARRVQVASRQSMLLQRMVKAALLSALEGASRSELEAAMAEFARAHEQLWNGGPSLPAITVHRSDLLNKWVLIDELWQPFRSRVSGLAAPRLDSDILGTLQALQTLEEAMADFTSLCALPDPVVGSSFPYSTLAYASILVFFLLVVSAACFASSKARRQQLMREKVEELPF